MGIAIIRTTLISGVVCILEGPRLVVQKKHIHTCSKQASEYKPDELAAGKVIALLDIET